MAAASESESNAHGAESSSSLVLPIEELLGCRAVEKQRLEFKAAWNNDKSHKRGTYCQVLHTVTAFANDYFNENGGYIVIGVKEIDDKSSRDWEVCGIEKTSLDVLQQQIKGACQGNIRPSYCPVISPEIYQEKHVLVLWAQAGDDGPYECRESAAKDAVFRYYIRKGPETLTATTQERQTLLMRKNKTPFDDRMARDPDSGNPASLKDIDFAIFSSFLNAIGSKLLRERDEDELTLFRKCKMLVPFGDRKGTEGELIRNYVPRNFSILFFNECPHDFFRGAKIEVAWYKAKSKKVIGERKFEGPLHLQIRECRDLILKATQEEISFACTSYPQQALTEALVNAVYHRGYEPDFPDPVKVHVSPDGITITSYPGPDSTLTEAHFREGGTDVPLVPARNRRIGELLKELKLAEMRGAGVPAIFDAMETNNNPPPSFAFNYKYFKVTLPSHPVYQTQLMISDVDKLVACGEKQKAFYLLLEFIVKKPSVCSELIAQKLAEHFPEKLEHTTVRTYFSESKIIKRALERQPLIKELNEWADQEPLDIETGVEIIQKLVRREGTLSDLRCAILKADYLCRSGTPGLQNLPNLQDAHRLFEAMGSTILQNNARAAFQYASCKFCIFYLKRDEMASPSCLDYLEIAKDYANKAFQLTLETESGYRANQLRLLGEVKYWLILHDKATPADVRECFADARKYNPNIRINPLYNDPQGMLDQRNKQARRREVEVSNQHVLPRPLGRGRGRGRGTGSNQNVHPRSIGRGRGRGRSKSP